MRRGGERGALASQRRVANRGVLRDASLLGATDAVVGRSHVVVHLRASAKLGGVKSRAMLAVSIPVRRGGERGARASERGVADRGVLRDAPLLGATDAVVGRRHVVVHLRASAEASGVSWGDEAALSVASDDRDVGNQRVEHVCCGILRACCLRLFDKKTLVLG